mmetsp:Transcript_1844/g.4853  ORF Transcript_1844/g.4853 Transcript_1844/m.4853 type:complete len:318 (-) Transcript_1844:820-1773(-)
MMYSLRISANDKFEMASGGSKVMVGKKMRYAIMKEDYVYCTVITLLEKIRRYRKLTSCSQCEASRLTASKILRYKQEVVIRSQHRAHFFTRLCSARAKTGFAVCRIARTIQGNPTQPNPSWWWMKLVGETTSMTNVPLSAAASEKKGKNIFVTVGTTQFDALISSATSEVALEWMERQGFSSLTVQYGRGEKPELPSCCSLEIQTYDFRPSLMADMERADLILSHAGAGTVMEVLRMKKTLIVVINTDLMDNHQTELAGAMADRKHLLMVPEPKLLHDKETWASFDEFVPLPHEQGDPYDMPRLLDSFLGLSQSKVD